MAEALMIIDVQNDFLPGGALAVADGDRVIGPINQLASEDRFGLVLATRDWHPADHASFQSQGGPWPEHCVQNSLGAELDSRLDHAAIDVVIDTGVGREDDGYSAFESEDLRLLLREEDIVAVTITGLATDVCVLHTARAALREGLLVTIPAAAVRGINADDSAAALAELAQAGAQVV